MNSLVSKARWSGALVTAGALLLAGAGGAGADDAPDGPVRGVPRTVALDSWPASVAVGPDGGKAYVSVKDDHGVELKVVDTRSGAITATVTLDSGVGAEAGPVAVSPDGSRVYVLFGPSQLMPLSVLGAVDPATSTVVSRTPAPDQPRPEGTDPGGLTSLAVSPDGARVHVTQDGPAFHHGPVQPGARVLEFSPQQQAFTAAVAVPGHVLGSVVARPGGDDAYVGTDEGLVHLDTSAEPPTVAGTVATTACTTAGTTVGLALTPDDTRLYGVSDTGTGFTVDPATDTVTATMTITPGRQLLNPVVSPDGTRLYTVYYDFGGAGAKGSVLSLDTSTNTLVPGEGVTGLDYVTSLAVGPDAHTFYLTTDRSLRIVGF